ncbi:hypothetical protein M378DRAFT_534354 [Amanita muscaria Koide BX008]|uniref:Uncharacterized protein n=1 Tax=Amanita muscaria (strain Koide BX008) TaxID=946122 RepID=A0A0C2SPR1_AMAMK|nr:hypothetical protein M378DRAFT_534354 [Amanita muscaria Koide BX008]
MHLPRSNSLQLNLAPMKFVSPHAESTNTRAECFCIVETMQLHPNTRSNASNWPTIIPKMSAFCPQVGPFCLPSNIRCIQ